MSFVASHQAPLAGMPTWDQPDAARPGGPQLPGGLDVRVVEWWGDWAHVECSNGWKAWVDGRTLRPVAAAAPAPAPHAAPAPNVYQPVNTTPPTVAPIRSLDTSPVKAGPVTISAPLVGGVLALISVFLPWFSPGAGVKSSSSMKVPAKFLFDNKQLLAKGGLKLGVLLIVAAVAAIGLSLRPISRVGRRAAGLVLTAIPTLYLAQIQRAISATPGSGQSVKLFSVLGFGVYVCFVAGLLVSAGKVPGEQGKR